MNGAMCFVNSAVPGERGGYVGGVLGIDPTSQDRTLAGKGNSGGGDYAEDRNSTEGAGDGIAVTAGSGPVLTMGKIQLLKREDAAKKSE